MNTTKKEKKKKQKENRKKSQSVCPTETCAREATEATDSRVVGQDIDWFISFWNRTMEEHHAKIPRIDFLKKSQLTRLKCRQYHFGKERLRVIIIKAAKSDYLNCRTGKRANMQIDWYLDHDHLESVLQGKYDNYEVEERALTAEEQRRLQAERYRTQQAERRAEARRIDDEEHERMERQRDERQQQRASVEDIKRILGDRWLLD
ncbi:MAG: hypothetical protein IJ700_02845 [Bacteroidaceae bacterium]|nr:hypothetical protein [Bacteroidaceae bacterium]